MWTFAVQSRGARTAITVFLREFSDSTTVKLTYFRTTSQEVRMVGGYTDRTSKTTELFKFPGGRLAYVAHEHDCTN